MLLQSAGAYGQLQNCALRLAAVAPMPGLFLMGCRRDLHMLSATHTFVAFVDIFNVFDTSWVEATMVELFAMWVHGRMWALSAHFVHGTFSQVRSGSDLSETWQDSGIAQGKVLSPLLFNILVGGRCTMHVRALASLANFTQTILSP